MEFRLLLLCLGSALRVMFTVMCFSAFWIYIAGTLLAEGTLDYCIVPGERTPNEKIMCDNFGTLGRALRSLVEVMYGGRLWGDLVDAFAPVSVYAAFGFTVMMVFAAMFFMTFATSMVTNYTAKVNDVLLDSIIRQGCSQKDLAQEVMRAFHMIDLNMSASVSRDEFAHACASTSAGRFLASLHLDTNSPDLLFDLLDSDHSGNIEIDEFVAGCINLQGTARAIDVARLHLRMDEFRQHTLDREADDDSWDSEQEVPAPSRSDRKGTRARTTNRAPTSAQPHRGRRRHSVEEEGSDGPRVGMQRLGAGTIRRSIADSRNRGLLGRKARGPRIKRVEMRAMKLEELSHLRTLIRDNCRGWLDTMTGKMLTPSKVNLYHLNYYLILPETLPEGVVLQGLHCEEAVAVGQPVAQLDSTGRYAVPLAEGVVRSVSETGDIQVQVIKGCFSPRARVGDDSHVEIEWSRCGVPEEVLTAGNISYKELISSTPTRPHWFCSHWWGESLFSFVSCCEEHSKLRQLDEARATYWICAYANSQHDLSEAITTDPSQTSFAKAMKLAEGVLLILDSNATPFTRIWCDYELYLTSKHLSKQSMSFDIVTVPSGSLDPVLLSDLPLPGEPEIRKIQREQLFPITLLLKGISMFLQDGDASVQADKGAILKCIAMEADGDVAVGLKRANGAIHGYLARKAWLQAIKKGIVDNFDEEHPGTIGLPAVLASDESLFKLDMSFAFCEELTEADVQHIVAGFPPNIKHLKLSFEGCDMFCNRAIKTLASALPSDLLVLELDFGGCQRLNDDGVKFLAEQFPSSVQDLYLVFAACPDLNYASIVALGECLPNGIKNFQANFQATKMNLKFGTPRSIRRCARSHGSNKNLKKAILSHAISNVRDIVS